MVDFYQIGHYSNWPLCLHLRPTSGWWPWSTVH